MTLAFGEASQISGMHSAYPKVSHIFVHHAEVKVRRQHAHRFWSAKPEFIRKWKSLNRQVRPLRDRFLEVEGRGSFPRLRGRPPQNGLRGFFSDVSSSWCAVSPENAYLSCSVRKKAVLINLDIICTEIQRKACYTNRPLISHLHQPNLLD